ncbi:MAG TPA: flagellar filament capping protein FliD [Solirubrobacteraceae bacterium]|nr:flagellar filament capping protein FliD [Solirubrobacteraceae bacterium]
MSTSSISSSGSAIQFSGLASGLDTHSIIEALLAAEKVPVTRLTNQQEKLVGQQGILSTLQSKLQQLTFSAFEFELPSLFEGHQSVTSSEPSRVTATITSGAGVGGYQVEVTQLANSAQRSFAFTSPTAEDTITIDGREYTFKAGATAKEVAAKINSDGKGTVFAAVQGEGTIVLSSRTTGVTGGEYIKVTDEGETLVEKEGSAKEGRNAEYKVDGVAGTSTTNTLTEAIPGVTLTLGALTSAGAVTIAVQPPQTNVATIEKQVESFVALYNTTVEEIETQLTTKPLGKPESAEERAVGSLYGDSTLRNLLAAMRTSMYQSIEGLPEEMSSPLSIGISTGAATGGKTSQAALQGVLKLDPAKLAKAIQENPEAAKTMMQKWATGFKKTVEAVSGPGGALSSRIEGDSEQVREMKIRITTMNDMIAVRQRALEQTYAQLEAVMSRNSAQSSWLTSQTGQLEKSGL